MRSESKSLRWGRGQVVIILAGIAAERRARRECPQLSDLGRRTIHESAHAVASWLELKFVSELSVELDATEKVGRHVGGFCRSHELDPRTIDPNWATPTKESGTRWQGDVPNALAYLRLLGEADNFRAARRAIRRYLTVADRILEQHWSTVTEVATALRRESYLGIDQLEELRGRVFSNVSHV
jgi:hypothetical protein